MSVHLRRVALAAVLAIAGAGAAAAYPTRPVRLVTPFPAGGTADILARQIVAEVSAQLGQPLVVDNRGGANGIVGIETVAKAPPDGYTLLHSTASIIINEHVYRKLPYDTFRDFEPVATLVLGTGYLLLVNPAVPVSSMKELIALAKKSDKLSYSSPGIGNTLHLAAELFNVRAGVKLLHVPYKGAAPAMNAVLSGEVQVTFLPATIAATLVKSGRLKAIAFTGASRWPAMPELPTMTEQGISNLELTGSWHGWFAPAKTPPGIVAQVHREVEKALRVPRLRENIVAGGYEPDGRGPAEFRTFLKREYDRYGEMVRAANIPKE